MKNLFNFRKLCIEKIEKDLYIDKEKLNIKHGFCISGSYIHVLLTNLSYSNLPLSINQSHNYNISFNYRLFFNLSSKNEKSIYNDIDIFFKNKEDIKSFINYYQNTCLFRTILLEKDDNYDISSLIVSFPEKDVILQLILCENSKKTYLKQLNSYLTEINSDIINYNNYLEHLKLTSLIEFFDFSCLENAYTYLNNNSLLFFYFELCYKEYKLVNEQFPFNLRLDEVVKNYRITSPNKTKCIFRINKWLYKFLMLKNITSAELDYYLDIDYKTVIKLEEDLKNKKNIYIYIPHLIKLGKTFKIIKNYDTDFNRKILYYKFINFDSLFSDYLREKIREYQDEEILFKLLYLILHPKYKYLFRNYYFNGKRIIDLISVFFKNEYFKLELENIKLLKLFKNNFIYNNSRMITYKKYQEIFT